MAVKKSIKKGDRVLVIAGNERGRAGEVLSVEGDRLVIQGLNMRKRHLRKSQLRPQGGVIEFEQSIHRSNIVLCDADNQRIKLKLQVTPDERQLVYERNGNTVVHRVLRKRKQHP